MRIGLLIPSIYMHKKWGEGKIFAPGSLAINLADGLFHRGHDVYLYSAPGVQTDATLISGESNLIEQDLFYNLIRNRSKDVQKYSVEEIRQNEFEYGLTLQAYKDALAGKLDIIHSFLDYGAHYFDELTGFPTLYTLHDPMPEEGMVEYLRLKRFPHHKYISISDSQRKGFPINFIGTVHHGVKLQDFEFGEKGDECLIFFGRLIKDKGAHTAVEVSLKVHIPLKIASSAKRAFYAEKYYLEKIKPYVGNDLISEVGFLEGKSKSDYIRDSLAFIFPLQWEEPFGMALIESMACGTPVVAYARGSIPELIKDGMTGFLVNQTNEDKRGDWIIKKTGIEGLAEAVQRIKSMGADSYNKMRINCRKCVDENFTVERMVKNYECVYEKIVSHQSRRI